LQEDLAPILAAGSPKGPLVQEYNKRFGTVPVDWEFAFELDRFFRGVYHADQTHHSIFLKLLEDDGPADLNLVYYGTVDVGGHYFWRYRQPDFYEYTVPQEQVDLLADRLDRIYEQMDVWIGETVAKLPEDATIMLISDHGMVASNPAMSRNKQSGGHDGAPPGAMVLSGPGVENRGLLPAGRRNMGGIYDITPTLLNMLDLSTGSYMRGKALRKHMTAEWQLAHPELAAKDYRVGFRPATRPLVPEEGMNEAFVEALNQIGYVD
jgi:predicted AlkP superfamily phosphohydrolase/phosphomutase